MTPTDFRRRSFIIRRGCKWNVRVPDKGAMSKHQGIFRLSTQQRGGRLVDKREDSSGRFGGLDTLLLRRAGIPVSSNAVRASEPDGVLS
jgi:hypothetical protein